GDGKTTTAANLAIVLAQAGKQVILVDADFRAPTLHKVFGTQNVTGLTSLLLHDYMAPASALVQTRVDRLQLLPSGPLPPNPSELAASPQMRHQLGEVCKVADVVVIDGPPVLDLGDAPVLGSLVDGVLLVIDARRTRGPEAAHTIATLQHSGGQILGA